MSMDQADQPITFIWYGQYCGVAASRMLFVLRLTSMNGWSQAPFLYMGLAGLLYQPRPQAPPFWPAADFGLKPRL